MCVCGSRVRCGVRFSLAVLVSKRHLVHVHGAHLGLGHRQQQHRHTDGAAGRESVNTVWPRPSACLPVTRSQYQPTATFLSLPFLGSVIFLLFLPLQRQQIGLFLLFSFLFVIRFYLRFISLFCGYCLPISSIYNVCIHIDFRLPGVGGGIVVCLVCLCFNIFIFLTNIILRPEDIKSERTSTENRPQLLLMHVPPTRTKADHRSSNHNPMMIKYSCNV